MGTRGKWLLKNSYLWDSNKDQATSGISRELIVRLSSRSFTLKTIESGPKSKVLCVRLLETVKCIVLIVNERVVSWKKVWKTKRKFYLCCNKTTNRNARWLFIISWYLCLFWNGFIISFLCPCRGKVLIGGCTVALAARIFFGNPSLSFF